MATKSFTANIKFNQKQADSLIKALDSNRKPKFNKVTNVEVVRDSEAVRKMFSHRKVEECR